MGFKRILTEVYLEHWVKRKHVFFERTLRSKTKGSM
jgi:hypothetical protein